MVYPESAEHSMYISIPYKENWLLYHLSDSVTKQAVVHKDRIYSYTITKMLPVYTLQSVATCSQSHAFLNKELLIKLLY